MWNSRTCPQLFMAILPTFWLLTSCTVSAVSRLELADKTKVCNGLISSKTSKQVLQGQSINQFQSINSLLKTDVAWATGQCRQCRVTGSLANISQWDVIYFTDRLWVIFNDDFITNLLPSRQRKNSENQLAFGEDMGNSLVAPFFMARCSNVQTVWPNKASLISGASHSHSILHNTHRSISLNSGKWKTGSLGPHICIRQALTSASYRASHL